MHPGLGVVIIHPSFVHCYDLMEEIPVSSRPLQHQGADLQALLLLPTSEEVGYELGTLADKSQIQLEYPLDVATLDASQFCHFVDGEAPVLGQAILDSLNVLF